MAHARLVGTAILAALAFAGAANAQNVNPNSTTNVTPTATASDAAQLEVRRRALFASMLRDPANLDIAFEYAALSVQVGDLESAISTLERMLIFAPGLSRLQFELGVLYFRLGAYETADTYFAAAVAAPDVPPAVVSEIGAYRAAIDQRGSGAAFSAIVSTGVRYQTNANAGPASSIVDLNGIGFVLNAGATSQPDVNGFVTANLQSSVDLASQGDRIEASLSAYGALYKDQTQLNTGVVEMKAGPTWNLQRIGIDNATFGVQGIAGTAILGGELYFGALGVGTTFTQLIDARNRLVIQASARQEQYRDTTQRPSSSARSGQRYTASVTHEHQLNADLGLFGTLSAERRVATTGYLSNWQATASVGAQYKFDSPIATLDGRWTVALSGGVRHQVGDAPDPVFSATAVETIDQVFVQGALTVPLDNGYAVQTAASYTASMSNYSLSNYTNLGVSVALSKGF